MRCASSVYSIYIYTAFWYGCELASTSNGTDGAQNVLQWIGGLTDKRGKPFCYHRQHKQGWPGTLGHTHNCPPQGMPGDQSPHNPGYARVCYYLHTNERVPWFVGPYWVWAHPVSYSWEFKWTHARSSIFLTRGDTNRVSSAFWLTFAMWETYLIKIRNIKVYFWPKEVSFQWYGDVWYQNKDCYFHKLGSTKRFEEWKRYFVPNASAQKSTVIIVQNQLQISWLKCQFSQINMDLNKIWSQRMCE